MFEYPNFAAGTKTVMDAVVRSTAGGATTIIGESFLGLHFMLSAIWTVVGEFSRLKIWSEIGPQCIMPTVRLTDRALIV